MKALVFCTSLLAMSLTAVAQDLPAPSPAGSFQQRLGLTDIKVEYSRPGVKGRTIFGDLVPYDQLWRMGANQSTKVTFSTDVLIAGNPLAAGTYALFAIPGAAEWVIIFNKNLETWGVDGYKEADDALRVSVRPSTCAATERLSLGMENFGDDHGMIYIRWATTEVNIPVKVMVTEAALRNIDEAIAKDPSNWRVYRNAANFYVNNDMDKAKALGYINKSVELNPTNWYSNWLQAEILASNEDYKGAVKSAENALKLGKDEAAKSGQPFTYEGMINEGLTKWKELAKTSKKKKK